MGNRDNIVRENNNYAIKVKRFSEGVLLNAYFCCVTKKAALAAEKLNLHPRNRHRARYDFHALIKTTPELGQFVSVNQYGDMSIDFQHPEAVKTLNRALLKHFYGIALWDIPSGYLCPPIPGRADYIHYAADLLAGENQGTPPTGKHVKVLDIGVGANCIYPLIGTREYGWKFIGSEVDAGAIKAARNIVQANQLSDVITIRKQAARDHLFTGIIHPAEKIDLTVCNPPFYSSLAEARDTAARKWTKLGKSGAGHRNFGGQASELWFEGGEQRFVIQMIRESADYGKNCLWFTSLISSKETLPACLRMLKKVGAVEVKVISMAQGQKVSRILAWTFCSVEGRGEWRSSRWT